MYPYFVAFVVMFASVNTTDGSPIIVIELAFTSVTPSLYLYAKIWRLNMGGRTQLG